MTALTVTLLLLMAVGVGTSGIMHARLVARRPPPDRELAFYEVAYMTGGRARVAEVALAYLVWAGLVDIRPGAGLIATVSAPSDAVDLRPVESALLATIPADGRKVTVPLAAARDAARWVERDLNGLVVPVRDRLIARMPAVGTALLAAVWALGVGFSLTDGWRLLAVVPLIAAVVIGTALMGDSHLTAAGKRMLEAERERLSSDIAIARVGVTSLPIERGLYLVALHGRSSMTGELAPLRRVIR